MPGAEIKQAFMGMFYSMITIVQGKFEALELNIKTESPYIFINTGVLGQTGNAMYEGFVNYAKALEACVTEKIPAVYESAAGLPDQAEAAKDSAMGEFNDLDIMKKGKALLNVGLNIKILAKIPAFIKTALEGFKADLTELKDSMQELKANLDKIKTAGGQCIQKGVSNSVDCYKTIHGPIKYTA